MSAPLLFAILHAFESLSAEALPAPHRLTLLLLADFADEQRRAWPGVGTLARRAGLAERTMDVVLAELEAAGWVKRDRRPVASGRNLSTVYTVEPSGGVITRQRKGRHGAPAAPSSGAPVALERPSPEAPAAPGRAPGAPTGRAPAAPGRAPGAPDPIKDPTRADPTKDPSRAPGAPGRGRELPPLASANREAESLVAELERHPEIVGAARGDRDALPVLASKILSEAMIGKGKPLQWVLAAIREAAVKLAFEPGILWAPAAGKVLGFAKNARAPDVAPRDPGPAPTPDPPPLDITVEESRAIAKRMQAELHARRPRRVEAPP